VTWLPGDFVHPVRGVVVGRRRAGRRDVERKLGEFVPRWLADQWPLPAPARYVGRDLSWADWNALPARD
jgi:hypothetical protein